MPVTMIPARSLVLSWDMFTPVPAIPPENGQSLDAQTTCRFVISFSGGNVTVTVTPAPPAEPGSTSNGLQVRMGATRTPALLKHEQDHADSTFLSGLAAGKAIAGNQRHSNATIARHQAVGATLQERYDQQTMHGTNQKQQDRWNALLDAAIALGQTTVAGIAL